MFAGYLMTNTVYIYIIFKQIVWKKHFLNEPELISLKDSWMILNHLHTVIRFQVLLSCTNINDNP